MRNRFDNMVEEARAEIARSRKREELLEQELQVMRHARHGFYYAC